MGDVLFTLICFCNSQDIYLSEAFERVMEKYKIRDKDRFKK
ncbi:MAG: MazG nucleotide pyrophosphohydrolase domain-containing protein [archaeon]